MAFNMFYRYSRWDGTQEISPFTADELMEAISDDLISEGDPQNALQRIFRWGMHDDERNMPGLQDLLERLRERKQRELDRYDLSSVMDEFQKRLEDVVKTERSGIERRKEQAQAPSGEQSREPNGEQKPPGANDRGADNGAQQPGNEGQQTRQPQSGRPQSPSGESPDGSKSQQSPGQSEAGQSGEAGESDQSGSGEMTPEEQASLRQMLESMADRKLQFLESLPKDFGGAVQALSEYDFMEPEAREKFQELMKMLQQQILGQRFQGMKDQISALKPEDLQQLRDMIRDLNRMLQEKARTGQADFESFKQKHGQFFPPDINSLDELIEHLQRQIAQMQSLLDSMPKEMRQQLQSMMDAALQDDRLKWDLAQLGALLERLMPSRQFKNRYPFHGDESLSMSDAMDLMKELQGLDQLERQLKRAHGSEGLDAVDADELERALGKEAREQLDELRQLMKMLEEAGYVQKTDRGWELTARGMRKVGQKALRDIFGKLKRDAFGKHEVDHRGIGGERTDDYKQYEFGDAFHLNIHRTMMNSLVREGKGSPLRLHPTDFSVYSTELMTESSTVLMVDMSRSMILRGCFQAAKKVALALDSLIRGQFPKDNLYVIAFSDYARELKPDKLPQITWDEEVYGTNMQHGFMLARKLLSRHKSPNKQIIMITDGEPTAHLESGRAYFSYPPTYRTVQETLKEVNRCTRDQIVINTFMLERGYYLVDFVNQMTKINRGRAFFATPDRLGEYILVDYVANKRKVLR